MEFIPTPENLLDVSNLLNRYMEEAEASSKMKLDQEDEEKFVDDLFDYKDFFRLSDDQQTIEESPLDLSLPHISDSPQSPPLQVVITVPAEAGSCRKENRQISCQAALPITSAPLATLTSDSDAFANFGRPIRPKIEAQYVVIKCEDDQKPLLFAPHLPEPHFPAPRHFLADLLANTSSPRLDSTCTTASPLPEIQSSLKENKAPKTTTKIRANQRKKSKTDGASLDLSVKKAKARPTVSRRREFALEEIYCFQCKTKFKRPQSLKAHQLHRHSRFGAMLNITVHQV